MLLSQCLLLLWLSWDGLKLYEESPCESTRSGWRLLDTMGLKQLWSRTKISILLYQALPVLNFEEISCEIGKANKLLKYKFTLDFTTMWKVSKVAKKYILK